MFYTFWIGYTGAMAAADIQSARVYLPDGNSWWTINHTNYLDNANGVLGGTQRFSWTSHTDYLPIGDLKAEIIFTNWSSTILTFTTNQPGSISNGSYTQVVSQEIAAPTSNTVKAPVRPTVTAFTNSGTDLTISFSLANLTNIHNGFVWIYDNSQKYLGGFFYFSDKTTGAVYTGLNGGSSLVTGSNTLIIPISAISPASGQTTASITANAAHCCVVIMDGSQYVSRGAGHYADYDYRSISNYY